MGGWKKIFQVLDLYTWALLATVVLATICPVYGRGYQVAATLSQVVVALLFFLHGVKLSPASLWAGLTNWRLQMTILGLTFVLFPLLGYLSGPILRPLVGPELQKGLMFLCVLPSTIQSSIAFTSMARGNVAAAVCAASASSILGVFLTPVLAGLFLGQAGGGGSSQAVIDITQQLLLPFLLGQALRFKLAPWLGRHHTLIGYVDRLSILFIVYVSFSHGTVAGLWSILSPATFGWLLLISCLWLALAMVTAHRLGRAWGFNRADRLAVLFCGSKKSLAAGVPMANILFTPALASTIILPLMIFHQIQLMVCAKLATRLAQGDLSQTGGF